MERSEQQGAFEISSDGATVWVNGGICVGRFCRYGIDVAESLVATMTTPPYPEGGTRLADWRVFQVLMQEHYNVAVSDHHAPTFLQHPFVRNLEKVLRKRGYEGERLEVQRAKMLERFPFIGRLWDSG
jgi:hypothetical protein